MIQHGDRRKALTGYAIDIDGGERLHFWPDTGLVISERNGVPLGIGLSPAAAHQVPLTDATVGLLQHLWRGYDFMRRLLR